MLNYVALLRAFGTASGRSLLVKLCFLLPCGAVPPSSCPVLGAPLCRTALQAEAVRCVPEQAGVGWASRRTNLPNTSGLRVGQQSPTAPVGCRTRVCRSWTVLVLELNEMPAPKAPHVTVHQVLQCDLCLAVGLLFSIDSEGNKTAVKAHRKPP